MKAWGGLVFSALLVLGASLRLGASENTISDYDRELAEIDHRLSLPLTERAGASVAAVHAAILAEKALLTEAPVDLTRAREAVEQVMGESEILPAFVALHAKLALQLHQTRAAEEDVEWLETYVSDYPESAGLRVDLLIDAGQFGAARAGCDAALKRRRDWPLLARLAQIESLTGQEAKAEKLYREAQDTLTAKQMRAFSWLEAQRGRLDANRGKWEEADQHYLRADRAYSGLWRVAGLHAEASGARGRYAEAIALYEGLARRTERPEFFQALGDLYRLSGNPRLAKHWHERALDGYQASAERGEVLYYHHLSEFYADVRGDGEAAVAWARRDCELRPGLRPRQALAWALYRKGEIGEAQREISLVLTSGLQNAHLFEQAARITLAAGHEAEAQALRVKATSLNPHYADFHAHY